MKASAQPRLLLTDRDIAICEFVFSYGGVDIRHIQAKFFPTSGARAAAYARASKLIAAGYLHAKRLPSQSGVGSGPYFLSPGLSARPLLAERLNCSIGKLRRATRMHVPQQLAHHLKTCDFRLAIELGAEASGLLSSVEWISEWELRSTPVRIKEPGTGGTLTVIADGAFTLTLTDESDQSFYIEIDMATMTEPRRMRSRLKGWLLAAKKQPVPVLFVTTTENRAQTLARLAREEAEKLRLDSTIFWITLHDAVTPGTVLTKPIWQVVGGPDKLALLGGTEAHAFVDEPPSRQEAYA